MSDSFSINLSRSRAGTKSKVGKNKKCISKNKKSLKKEKNTYQYRDSEIDNHYN